MNVIGIVFVAVFVLFVALAAVADVRTRRIRHRAESMGPEDEAAARVASLASQRENETSRGIAAGSSQSAAGKNAAGF